MSTQTNDYHISFFKPTTPQAKANRNMVVLFFCIWAVAIFGFQILLKVLEKPVPEQALTTFQGVWKQVDEGAATNEELKEFAKSTMSVLGKVMIKPDDKTVLNNALSWSVMQIADSTQQVAISSQLTEFEDLKSGINDITDKQYVLAKESLGSLVSGIVGFDKGDVRAKILPLELVSSEMGEFKSENKEKIVSIMEKYLVHNRSALTDFTFLGFPFHYFYTAVFLLILFVGLCWMYCKRTDNMNESLNIVD